MTRTTVYAGGLLAFAAATAMTVAANTLPLWLSYTVRTPKDTIFSQKIGLHESCSSPMSPQCRPFPSQADCSGDDRSFCTMWRSVGFLMSLALITELVTIVGFIIIMSGGKMKRETGWKALVSLLAVTAAVEMCAMSLVTFLLDHDDKFLVPGWKLDSSFILCAVSSGTSALCALGLTMSAYILPPEDGYEFLRDPVR